MSSIVLIKKLIESLKRFNYVVIIFYSFLSYVFITYGSCSKEVKVFGALFKMVRNLLKKGELNIWMYRMR